MKKFVALSLATVLVSGQAAPAWAQGPVRVPTVLAFAQSPSEARWGILELPKRLGGMWVNGRVTGHEEITRQALVKAQDHLKRLGIDPKSRNVADFLGDLDVS
jgi:hypothetical protein